MPLNFVAATRCGEMWCVESDGDMVGCQTTCRLSEVGWIAAKQTLQNRPDSLAVIVSQPDRDDLLSEAFDSAWNLYPARLASLAVRPPDRVGIVARATESSLRLLNGSQLTDSQLTDKFALWRWLVDLAKQDTSLTVLRPEGDDEFLELTESRPLRIHDAGLPELLSSPPRRELDWLFGELSLIRLSDLCDTVVSSAAASFLRGRGDVRSLTTLTVIGPEIESFQPLTPPALPAGEPSGHPSQPIDPAVDVRQEFAEAPLQLARNFLLILGTFGHSGMLPAPSNSVPSVLYLGERPCWP